ncbi:MAG: hypothetical protein ACXU8N_12890 [Telluria sp.]
MQDKTSDPGFRLPSSAPSSPAAGQEAGQAPMQVVPSTPPATDTSTRDAAIGASVFLALLAAYFFIRGAFVHHLVVRRVAPAAAASAGWLLFVALSFLSGAIVLAIVNAHKFLTWAVTGPLVLAGLLALAGSLLVGRR